MAAIDKLYVHKYTDYDDLRKWAIAYYPKLILHMYTIGKEEFIHSRYNWSIVTGKCADEYSCPIMNTPTSVDRKLKWICPVPCVREYLEKQCGIKTRWYHKLFWRGKKHFIL